MVPEVKRCSVSQCFYNLVDGCQAHAITVGSDKPMCETFAQSESQVNKKGAGEVGACHVKQCAYNDGMFCHSCDDIVVGWSADGAMCNTFRPG